jgi:hypothetical protein
MHSHLIHLQRFMRRHYHHRQHHPKRFYWLRLNECGSALRILLEKGKEPFIVSQLHVDQKVTLSIVATDAAGNPVAFKPDAATPPATNPTWTNSNPAADMVVSNDGLTAVLTPKADQVGQVTSVSMAVIVDGVTFTATDDLTIVEGAIAGVKLIETF